jgi:F-type H+-transporting ATPase subunit delta
MEESKLIALPYAKAAFEIALEQNQLDFWFDFLQSATLIASNPQIRHLLDNPNIENKDVLKLFFDLLQKQINEYGKNFLRLLVQFHRLAILPKISESFSQLRANYEKIVHVEITSALVLTDEQKTKMMQALKKRLQCKITLDYHTDKNILGGAIIRIGDFVIDGSGRSKLARLKRHLKGISL